MSTPNLTSFPVEIREAFASLEAQIAVVRQEAKEASLRAPIILATEAELPGAGEGIPGQVYFTDDTNRLWRHNDYPVVDNYLDATL